MSEATDRRSTDEIVAEVCAALNVEHVEIRRPARDDARPAPQIVRTAPFTYYGNDRLDVSPGSADPIGGWFAPSREIALANKAAWNQSNALGSSFASMFADIYTAEMRVRYGIVPGSEAWGTLSVDDQSRVYNALARGVEPTPSAWGALLAMREVTLVCTCADATRCHRVLLARILEKLGATYAGEMR